MSNTNSIFNLIKLPDYLSLANGLCGLVAILYSIDKQFDLAFLFISMAGLFDFFDGRIARRLNLASEFGKQLDSLCDLCSFIIAPAIFLFNVESINPALRIAAAFLYLLAGILRLARFNITGTIEGGKYFEGMPVPFSIAVVLSFFLFRYLEMPFSGWALIFVLHAGLMVSTVKIKKL